MRTNLAALALAAAGAVVATPAMADETRAEVHAGVTFTDGDTEEVLGVALGHDFSATENLFIGVEGSIDRAVFSESDLLFGLGLRGGVQLNEKSKAYATVGYTYSDNDDGIHAGAGYQFKIKEAGPLEFHLGADFF